MDEQTKQQAEVLGKRLALLLATLPLPEETRASLAALVPHMNEEQLGRFIAQLEEAMPEGGSGEHALAQGVQAAQDAYVSKQQEITQNTHAELDAIEEKLS